MTDMINFYDEKVRWNAKVVWHSLWWCLAQILATLEKGSLDNVYTYNSPWVERLLKELNTMRKENVNFEELWLIDVWKEYPQLPAATI